MCVSYAEVLNLVLDLTDGAQVGFFLSGEGGLGGVADQACVLGGNVPLE